MAPTREVYRQFIFKLAWSAGIAGTLMCTDGVTVAVKMKRLSLLLFLLELYFPVSLVTSVRLHFSLFLVSLLFMNSDYNEFSVNLLHCCSQILGCSILSVVFLVPLTSVKMKLPVCLFLVKVLMFVSQKE